ncbi:MAG: hypothetical protein A3H72_00070 [Candidatus Doudnabacteria bacterium RIFCSPLOWO2_02_FULL_48_8]|uniref:Methyltransferase domain-containing protein n=1 Tax=Candidatus Doudnabacteria bacterium RIFCSPHIGHO2_01_FULL_46_24 TaxID=1817825 RepID=A0A1F5NW38_9BACT|nr:MAG: hypothetical protein A2720_03540 [Candidatus Doudnabacteria bacterium RIFCSPHIGHO2_01_FULL_46_24]OGE95139.1 MAG: hypothetical protein A3H72_00070 [Candidatus Doudnabacteria bacterium RIFCSPLOWO2_02_FULL_48_8]OGE95638.1 MAG: hypothetical protein A3E98_01170 [Candidatus Doudnabacteria bacterium RIFCSPHIGHO2_12_FULL_48_11]
MRGFVFEPKTKFLDPEKIVFQTGLSKGQKVADLGAGNGFYAFASSKIVGDSGEVFVVDILEDALSHVSSEARLKGLRNIKTIRADLEQSDACDSIVAGSMDLVIFANVFHQIKNPEELFRQAYRLLKSGGKVLVVEWNSQPSPFGPDFSLRVPEKQVSEWANKKAFRLVSSIETDRYHYGLIFTR